MFAWDDLRYILAVHRHGSLARAAKALGLNKSTVSRRISVIEEQLGAALLQRGPNGYEFTEAGKFATAIAERIEQIVNELEANVAGADKTVKGTVSVTLPAWFAQHVVIQPLAELRKAHPGLDVHLLTTDQVLDLGRREADIGVRNVRPSQQSLLVRKAGVVDFAMYASRAYLELQGAPADRASFERHQVIAYADAVAYVEAFRWANALAHRVSFRATDAVSMLDAVAAGLGIGVLPCFLAASHSDLVCLDDVGGPAPEVIWLVSHPDAAALPRVRIVADWLVGLFKNSGTRLARDQ